MKHRGQYKTGQIWWVIRDTYVGQGRGRESIRSDAGLSARLQAFQLTLLSSSTTLPTCQLSVELAESQLAGGNPLSRPKQPSKGGSDRSDDPTQLKPKGRGGSDEGQRGAST